MACERNVKGLSKPFHTPQGGTLEEMGYRGHAPGFSTCLLPPPWDKTFSNDQPLRGGRRPKKKKQEKIKEKKAARQKKTKKSFF